MEVITMESRAYLRLMEKLDSITAYVEEAVRRAAAFTKKCVEKTEELGAPEQDGLCLEACLSYLTKLS